MITITSRNTGLLLAAFLLAACGGSETDAPAEPGPTTATVERSLRVETTQVTPTRFEERIQVTGSVESMDDAILSAQTGGTVTYTAELGDRVSEGDIVVRLDDRLVRASLNQAEANRNAARAAAELAEATFARQERLYADSIISALEFEDIRARRDQAVAVLNQAEATVSVASRQLEFANVPAPFDGRVEARMADVGEQVAPGMSLLRIVNTRRVKVTAGVPERYANDIEVGTPVTISLSGYGSGSRDASVTFVSSVIDPVNRTFTIEIQVDNASGKLKPEMIADIFVTRSVLENQIVIPQASILRDETGYSVYLVEDGMAVQHTVQLGASHSGLTVVESGLESGDQVITAGQTNVTDGDKVEITQSRS